jgi:hypothetical protein
MHVWVARILFRRGIQIEVYSKGVDNKPPASPGLGLPKLIHKFNFGDSALNTVQAWYVRVQD